VQEILTHKTFIYMTKPLHLSSYYPMQDFILIIIIDILLQVVWSEREMQLG